MTDLRTTDRRTLTTEYVAGGTGLWARDAARALPWAFDDLTQDFGDDLYERMQLDPQVIAVVNILRALILEEGVRLAPACEDPNDDGYALACEMCAAAEAMLDNLSTPIDEVLWDLLSAIALGSRVAEQVYADVPTTAYALPGTDPVATPPQLLALTALKVKPRRSTAFVVDPYMNVIGLLGAQPGMPSAITIGTTTTSTVDKMPNYLERERFAVLSWRPTNADPRGTTLLRPVYQPWWAKQQIWPEFLKYLAQFATASIVITASEEATKQGIKQDGEIKPAVEVLGQAAADFRNGSYLAVPYGTLVDALAVSGNGEAFHAAFTRCDQQITIAALHQTRATMESQNGSRADSETSQDILGTIQRQAKRSVARMLRRDVLMPLMTYNYGPDAARALCPLVSLGEVEKQDFAAFANAVAQLARSSYLDPSQYAGVDKLLNLPARDPASIAADTERKRNPPPPPAPFGGQPPAPADDHQGDQADEQDQEGNDNAG